MLLRHIVGPLVVASLSTIALAIPLVAQTAAPAAGRSTYTPPRTPWGDPDLQGIWPSTHMVGVPLERQDRFGDRLYLTDAEFKERQAAAAKQQTLDVLDFDVANPPPEIVALGDVGDGTSPPPHWLERGEPSPDDADERRRRIRGALHAHGTGHAAVRGDHQRSEDVDGAMDDLVSPSSRPLVSAARVRVS